MAGGTLDDSLRLAATNIGRPIDKGTSVREASITGITLIDICNKLTCVIISTMHSLIFFFLVLNLVKAVVLYIILSTWSASFHVFAKWFVGQKQLGHAGLYI